MSISTKPFGQLPDGQAVTQYTMTNARGASVSVIDYGGIVTSILVPDKNGHLDDVALGFDHLGGYLADHGCMATLSDVMATASPPDALRSTA